MMEFSEKGLNLGSNWLAEELEVFMLLFIQIILLLFQVLFAFLVGYLLLLTAVSWRAPRQTQRVRMSPPIDF